MKLRTAGIIAGVIGALVLTAGLIADDQRPSRKVTAVATLDAATVVIEPEMLAFIGDSRIGVNGEGAVIALSARPDDATAWLDDRTAVYVTGLPEWEVLATSVSDPAEAEPDGDDATGTPTPEDTTSSPTPSPTTEDATATPSPTPDEATPTPDDTTPTPTADDATATPTPDAAAPGADAPVADTSQDHWRSSWRGEGRVAVLASAVAPGETLVIVSADGSPLSSVDVGFEREVNDAWITPLIWWGVALTAVGLISLVLRFIDVRPAQARAEEWFAKRQRVGDPADKPRPGGRRARRSGDSPPASGEGGQS